MRLVVINPNSTVSMTDKIAAAARLATPRSADRRGTCHGSPPSIQVPADDAAALPFLLADTQAAVTDGADARIIACFDEPGLVQARATGAVPVLGIGHAAFHAAMLLGHHYSVVTTSSVSIPIIQDNIKTYGLGSHCLNVRASKVPVLDLEKPGSAARARISGEIGWAIVQDQATAIVRRCAGMADLAAALSAEHNVPVIDGVAAACGFAQTLVLLKHPAPRIK